MENEQEERRENRRRRVNIPLPPKLDVKGGSLQSNWKKFKRLWDSYEIVTNLNEEDTRYRTAVFLSCIGSDALDIYEGLSFRNEEERNDTDTVIRKFEEYCVGSTNETYEAFNFNCRHQTPGESIDEFVADLRRLIKTCNYGQLEDRLLRDQIVLGVRDETLRSKLLEVRQLTLTACIDMGRAHETSQQQTMQMTRKSQDAQEVQAFRAKKAAMKGSRERRQDNGTSCRYCGGKHPRVKEKCPAYGKRCNACGANNHFASCCKTNRQYQKKTKIRHIEEEDTDAESEDEILKFDDKEGRKQERNIKARMLINQTSVRFLLDTGATTNVMCEKLYREVTGDERCVDLQETKKKLVMFNGTEMKPVGEIVLRVKNPKNGKKYKVNFVITETDCKPVLGLKAVQGMQLLTVNVENIATIAADQKTQASAEDMLRTYSDVFEGEGKLEGQLHLETDTSVAPVKMPCRKWPIAVQEKVKNELKRLEKLDVVTKVETPTDWISSLVVATKSNGKVRLCIDPKPLNKALKRNEYPIPTIDDVLPLLQDAKYFTHLDARNGFWHVKLDVESSYLTTFETPFGKYRWKRMPFGISPAPEEFQRRMDAALAGLPGVVAIHDDIFVFGKGATDEAGGKDHDANLNRLLQRCRETGLKLNKDKTELKQTQISYLGHIFSREGLKADPKKLDAVQQLPTPEDKAAVQRLLGVVGYLQKFAPNLSEVAAPLRELVKKGIHFRWDKDVHGEALKKIKKILSEPPVLRYFDSSGKCATTLQCDASQFGLGACLMQDGQPVQYASRALTETEKSYAQIEKEMLAILFGLERFERYVYGREILVETDHKPLETIHKKSLLSAPKRIQRMLLRTQKFRYTVVYKRGTEMYLADTLSRAVSGKAEQQVTHREAVFYTELESTDSLQELAISKDRLTRLQQATQEDPTMKVLKAVILQGWPEESRQLSQQIQDYIPFREELSVQNGLVFKSNRIVVPEAERTDILEKLHASHSGIQSCTRRAREVVFWPRMNKDIEDFVKTCSACNTFQRAQQKEPLISTEIPDLPWQHIACDIFEHNGNEYLVTVDHYSDFFELDRLQTRESKEIIVCLKRHMARHGIPEQLTTDCGTQFTSSQFRRFSDTYGFEHVTSSPHYPKSNGKAESAVKAAKMCMKKAEHNHQDPFLALLELRNIPTEIVNSSPAQRLFSRRTRTQVPTSKKLLKPAVVSTKTELEKRKMKQAYYYNKSAVELTQLIPGQIVKFQPPGSKKWVSAKVDRQVDVRSYNIRTEDGRQYRRNRRHLRDTAEADFQHKIYRDEPIQRRKIHEHQITISGTREQTTQQRSDQPSTQKRGEASMKEPEQNNPQSSDLDNSRKKDGSSSQAEQVETWHQAKPSYNDASSHSQVTSQSETTVTKEPEQPINPVSPYRTRSGRQSRKPDYLKY